MHDLTFPLPAISWFVATASAAALAWAMGVTLGRSNALVSRTALVCSVVVLLAWGYLMRRQEVAVQVLPVSLLSRIEGVAAIPVFMLIVGIAWSRASMSRQRHVAAWAIVVGGIYFFQGGRWMVQATPAMGATQVYGNGYVLQSEDYTCVAAASATALNQLGILTTEAEMVQLTDTRAGTGATTLRAMAGLERKLQGTGFDVNLISPDYDGLLRVSFPALTPLQFDATRRHMVTLMAVTPEGVSFVDPMEGMAYMPRTDFENVYRGQVLVIQPKD